MKQTVRSCYPARAQTFVVEVTLMRSVECPREGPADNALLTLNSIICSLFPLNQQALQNGNITINQN